MTSNQILAAALIAALPLTAVADGGTYLPGSVGTDHTVFGKVPQRGESIELGCKIGGFRIPGGTPGERVVNLVYTNTGADKIAGGVVIAWTRGDKGGSFRLETPLAVGESRLGPDVEGGSGGCAAVAKHPYTFDLSGLRK